MFVIDASKGFLAQIWSAACSAALDTLGKRCGLLVTEITLDHKADHKGARSDWRYLGPKCLGD